MQSLPFAYVTVMSERVGKTQIISSVDEATEFLLYDWPVMHSAKVTTACQACLDALLGKITGIAARDAFIEAAKEAGIYIGQQIFTR
jgi:hypothetical protein